MNESLLTGEAMPVDKAPGAKLIPAAGTLERYRVLEWLNYISTELHKSFSPLFWPNMPEEAKKMLADAGYKGEKVVIIDATDQPIVHSQSLLTLENLKKIGINAEIQAGDWGTLITRRAVKETSDKGGWNIFHTWLVGPDMVNPGVAGMSTKSPAARAR